MGLLNSNFEKLEENYLFSEISTRVQRKKKEGWSDEILSLGIGDVTLPLPAEATSAMARASDEMGTKEGFRGYSPEGGYSFLREAIAREYKRRNISLSIGEIYVSDGSKGDLYGILDLFEHGETVAICDPVYPVYRDSCLIKGKGTLYLKATENNSFLPVPEGNFDARLIFLCSPNNPTGAVYNAEKLTKWVNYANETGAIVLYVGADEAFIQSEGVPHSIYEIKGAKSCAIEFRSFSKSAGFTGVRCGYTVIPKELKRDGISIVDLWKRRCAVSTNGVSYITQRGAEAVFSKNGQMQVQSNVAYYKRNAQILSEVFEKLGLSYFGGKDAPYLFLKCPDGMPSWEFFDELLNKESVICTPGVGFGVCGEGYVRFSALASREVIRLASGRLYRFLKRIY